MKTLALSSALLVLLVCTGCSRPKEPLEYDKDKICKRLNTAGYVAAIASLKVSKVDPETDLSKYDVVITTISEVMANMPQEGFKAVLPAVQKKIEEKYGDGNREYILIGSKLAANLLEEMEDKLQKNPKWVEHRDDLASMLSSFLDGASEGIKAYGGND